MVLSSVCFLVHGRNIWVVDQSHPLPEKEIRFDSINHFVEAILNRSLTIHSQASIRFSPGDHLLTIPVREAVKISGVSNLSILVGSPEVHPGLLATIKCQAAFGLSFRNITHMHISGLHFKGCGARSRLQLGFHKSVNIVLESNISCGITFDNVNITHSSGIGLLLTNTIGNLKLSNLLLRDNILNCYMLYQHIGAPECNGSNNTVTVKKYVHVIEDSYISQGVSCNQPICNSSAGGLTIVFNQLYYNVEFHIKNVRLLDNAGFGNVLVNASSCSNIHLLNFTKLKSVFTKAHSNGYGLQYHEFQCVCEAAVSRNVSVSQSLFNRSCVNVKLHDNFGLAAGVSWTIFQLHHTNISHSNYTAALEINDIYNVILDSVELSYNNGPFSFRVVNRLRLEKRFYSIIFNGSCAIKHNKGGISIRGDYVRLLRSTHLMFTASSETNISNNRAKTQRDKQYGAVMYISDIVVHFQDESVTHFVDNIGLISGGITAARSQIMFLGNPHLSFTGNTGNNGGAIALYEKSEFIFYKSYATIEFINNIANNYGGGVYVDDSSYLERISNTYIAPYFSVYCCSPNLSFHNNSAQHGGSAMYGGWVDWVNDRYIFVIKQNIGQFLHIESRKGDLSPIASTPTRVCWCSSEKPDCSLAASNQSTEIFPGETLHIYVVAIGQRNGTVSSTIYADFVPQIHHSKKYSKLSPLEKIQLVKKKCTEVKYTPISWNEKETLLLKVSNQETLRFEDKTIEELQDDPKYKVQFSDLYIDIKFKSCPFGYQFNQSTGLCSCVRLPQSPYDVYCKQPFQLVRKEMSWVGVNSRPTDKNESVLTDKTLIFGLCPFDYCVMSKVAVNLTTLDTQCNYNRSGILCGGCQGNLSRVFGSSRCKNCSDTKIIPLLIGFAVAGIGFIVLLLVLNLTISVGTINSLIFYANIANAGCVEPFLIPQEFTYSFLYKFIAVVNMATGTETCFYNGMTTYTKSWILFVFPCYIWLLSFAIITVCHFSSKASKLFGRNPVQVLATLFLFLYGNLLEITITTSAFSFSRISTANNHQVQYVWLLDGNIPYMSKKHALLFVATMSLLLFVCVPYTMVLITVQWLQRYSHKRILRWVLKLKPFIDAHMGPYKDKHRYWTGFLLVVRAGIFFLCTLNSIKLVNAALVIVISVCLMFYLLLVQGVYKSRLLNVIEIMFLFNLCALSTSCFFDVLFNSQNQKFSLSVAYLSVGSAFIYTCIILVYHTALRIGISTFKSWIKRILPPVLYCFVTERFKYQKLMGSDDFSRNRCATHSSVSIMDDDALLSDSYR